MPVGEPRKRRSVQNVAAERRQKRKERTRRHRGSRRMSAAACRNVSRRAKVTWRPRTMLSEKPGEHECSEGDYGRARKAASE
jgi:hypothetical protein